MMNWQMQDLETIVNIKLTTEEEVSGSVKNSVKNALIIFNVVVVMKIFAINNQFNGKGRYIINKSCCKKMKVDA